MIPTPDLKQFLQLAKKGNVIPVSIELPADLESPVSVFLKLASKFANAFLFESVELGERVGRFSLIGFDSDTVIEYARGVATVTRPGKKRQKVKGKFLDVVEKVLKQYQLVQDPTLPPLVGGLAGYIGYELVEQFETIKLTKKKGLSVPDAMLFVPTTLIVFDHIKHSLKLVRLAVVSNTPKRAYQEAVSKLASLAVQLSHPISDGILTPQSKKHRKTPSVRSNMTQKKFESLVKRAKGYIRAGDCIQVVLSQRFDLGTVQDDFQLYRSLRSLNPSPYLFYFRHHKFSLVGSSPEMLTRKTGKVAEVRPIAGTRPRGHSKATDLAFETQLKNSPKEMAEHVMLVDLGRNDLGRVCQSSTVQVPDFARIERYSHVMHLVSDVQATLKPGKSAIDLLRSTFPAGTVTGAPKIRAMQIIDELEPERRGPYAGSVGYFSLNGDLDMCITIRTIVVDHGHAYVQAGAGIVNDSSPTREYRETISKAQALLHCVTGCEGAP